MRRKSSSDASDGSSSGDESGDDDGGADGEDDDEVDGCELEEEMDNNWNKSFLLSLINKLLICAQEVV